jgi:hypothetical protein
MLSTDNLPSPDAAKVFKELFCSASFAGIVDPEGTEHDCVVQVGGCGWLGGGIGNAGAWMPWSPRLNGLTPYYLRTKRLYI